MALSCGSRVSDGELREGRDYQCAFYGGSLLSQIEFQPIEQETELINLIRINPNIIVMCDSDRPSNNADLKKRVERICTEVENVPNAHIWITCVKEIENYIPGAVFGKVLGLSSPPDPKRHEIIFPRVKAPGKSYIEKHKGPKHIDKLDLAKQSILCMTKEGMVGRFDWEEQLNNIVKQIKSWNT